MLGRRQQQNEVRVDTGAGRVQGSSAWGFLLALTCLSWLVFSTPASAQKTDSVTVLNSNLITGEVVSLAKGQLEYKTDSLGRLYIRWVDVRQLWSRHHFEVDLKSGRTIYGSLPYTPKLDTLVVWREGVTTLVPVRDVVGIARIKKTFWSRLRGSISLGIDFTKASNVFQFTFDSQTVYRGEKQVVALQLNSQITDKRNEQTVTRRQDAVLFWRQLIKGRSFGVVGTGAQQNQELGLDLRIFATGGAGYYLVRSTVLELSSDVGVAVTRETAVGTEEVTENIELPIGTQFSVFRRITPKINLLAKFQIYPNLTTEGRLRTSTVITWSHELLKDLYGDLTYFLSTDNAPPNPEAQKNDYGINFSLSWTFGT
jgi:hypothetical protein